MKLTKGLLVELIKEIMEHGGLRCAEVHPEHTHHEWEEHQKEGEEKAKEMAKISIKPNKKLPKILDESSAPISHEEPYKSPVSSRYAGGPPPLKGLAKYAAEVGTQRACGDTPEESPIPREELEEILQAWAEIAPADMTDEERWMKYAKDIEELLRGKDV